jgi:hypothetical protein
MIELGSKEDKHFDDLFPGGYFFVGQINMLWLEVPQIHLKMFRLTMVR